MFWQKKSLDLPTAAEALPGRAAAIPTAEVHYVNGHALKGPYPKGFETAVFALGCFWGAERKFWQQDGVWATAVGYVAGHTPNPTYEEVCPGHTGHTEAVLVAYDPAVEAYAELANTTEIVDLGPFYFAEGYHQQYLAKNPNGYCGLGGTGVSCPIGTGVAAQ